MVTDDYEIKLREVNERRQRLEKFFTSLEEFERLWVESEFQEKKHLLRTIFKEIKVGNGKIIPEWRF